MKISELEKVVGSYVLDKASLIILVADEDGKILYLNNYARELTGKDYTMQPLKKFFVTFDKDFNLEEYAGNGEKRTMLNVQTRSGLPQTYYFRFIKNGDDCIIMGEVDSMEVESLRKNLLNLNNELSTSTREMHKKNVELTKLNDLKNKFLGMAAHDLRNPLHIILGYSQFFLASPDQFNERQLAGLKHIESSSKFMTGLIDELLNISVIESGQLRLHTVEGDIVSFVQENVELMKMLAEAKKISIKTETEIRQLELEFDHRKIKQVIDNLMSNAVKYSPEGCTVITRQFVENEYYIFSVSDSGVGVSDDKKELIFSPFSGKSDGGTKGESSTGLGLAISKNIINSHGGKIWFDSKEGEGSTFYFSLPII